MDVRVIFGFSALMSFVSCTVIAQLYVWPWLRARPRDRALVSLVAPHMFLRFLGLSFLVPGVVSPALPAAFAVPAAYGDFVAGDLSHHSDHNAGETRILGHCGRMGIHHLGRC